MEIEENAPLAPLTTFRLGGPARFFVRVKNLDELKQALACAKTKNIQALVLGGGSNMLVSDAGFDGLVIKIEFSGVELEDSTLIAAAGESWDGLVARAVDEGLWGIENLSGIPGTVGAAPVQNIGAYGSELKDTLLWLEAFDIEQNEVVRFTNSECGFGYRTSVFKKAPGRYVILRVAFALQKDGTPNDSYKDLVGIGRFSLPEIRTQVLQVRARKFPDINQEGTAGSFFLNPTVSPETAAALKEKYPELPQFAAEGGVKLSLAWLLDKVLRLKGASVGGARLFERQPLVVVAARGARAQDVVFLAQKIKKEVQEKIGIEIEEEVRMIG
jgi:UDP-N-acetylmuramate dehydrogenase